MPLRENLEERLSVTKVKHQSRRLVFGYLFRNSPVTRAAIATETGLSQGTVKTIVDEFLESGILEEKKDTSTHVGRKPQKLYLQPSARTFGVLHLLPGQTEFYQFDLTLQPAPIPPVIYRTSPTQYGEQLAQFVSELRQSGRETLSGVGVIVPGAYDPATDKVSCHLMPELGEVSIRQIVSAGLHVPVSVGEDVHLAALAEAGHPYNAEQPFFYLYAGHGVGGSYVSEGRVSTGATGMAGEIGQVVMEDGRRLEELANWPQFLKACGVETNDQMDADEPTREVAEVSKLLVSGDPRCTAVLAQVVDRVSMALGSMVCIVNPRTILIGGPFGELGEDFLGPLRDTVLPRLMPEHRNGLQIVSARAGDRGMIRGAAFAALEKWFEAEYSDGGYQ